MTIPITGQPPIPDLSDPASFNTKALNLFTWMTGSMLDQFNAVNPGDWFGVVSGPMDQTAGKIMVVGSFGIGADSSITVTDWNASTVNGSHYKALGATNSPDVAKSFVGTYYRHSPTNGTQVLHCFTTAVPETYVRNNNGGVWTAWRKQYNSGNITISTADPTGGVEGDLWFKY